MHVSFHFLQQYTGWCGVTYTDNDNHYYEFQEEVRTDAVTYEEIETPEIDHFNQATILHDFEKVRKNLV